MFRSFSRFTLLWPIIILQASIVASLPLMVSTPLKESPAPIGSPVIDANFIYTQLNYMSTTFLKREAGYDNNLPANVNGHDEFANYWTQKMLDMLKSYGAQARRDPFSIQGWQGRPPTVAAFNVEVTVPGIVHPEEIVVIGCHYDGMAFSTQSAYDDASGCAIELGIARAMSEFWTKNHLYPARTLRFVIFDAEESGLFGSYHYVNTTINGDLNNIVAMFNEEQNGINYPLRYLGSMSNPLLPYYIDMSPLQSNRLYNQDHLTTQQRTNIFNFRQLMQQAVVASFQEFRSLGDQMLTYHSSSGQEVWQPIFTPDQLSNIHLEDDMFGASDQMPFTLAGLPCATLVGNSTYYNQDAPAGSYPYDQPSDTIQLMNTFAQGSATQSQALTLALGLPGMITAWMLSQPSILGQAPADGRPIAAIDSIGQTQPGRALHFAADAAYDPTRPGTSLSYHWNFGDGTVATGQTVDHTYARTGTYTLSMTISSANGGTRTIAKQLAIGQAPVFRNPYSGYVSNGKPPSNSLVTLPTPTNGPGDRVANSAQSPSQEPTSTSRSAETANPVSNASFLWFLVGVILLFMFIGGVIVLIVRRIRHG